MESGDDEDGRCLHVERCSGDLGLRVKGWKISDVGRSLWGRKR